MNNRPEKIIQKVKVVLESQIRAGKLKSCRKDEVVKENLMRNKGWQ